MKRHIALASYRFVLVMTLTWIALSPSAHALPNIINVVETGGDNEATDTIPAQWTGVTFTNGIANEPVAGKGANDPYTVGFFGEEAPMFVDRNHQWNGGTTTQPLPEYLVGGEYIMAGNDNRDNLSYQLDITVAEVSYVYMLVDDRMADRSNANPPNFPDWMIDFDGNGVPDMQWLLQEGWQPVKNGLNRFGNPDWPDHIGADEAGDGVGPGVGINQWSSVYVKRVPAGTFSIFAPDNGGQNMYGVVIKPFPKQPFVSRAIGNLFGVTFEVTDGWQTALNTNSVSLTMNGSSATPLVITRTNDVTTVKYSAPAPLPSRASIVADLTFSDNGNPVITTNKVFTFTVEAYGTLTAAMSVPLASVDTASPGFTVRVAQARDSAGWPGPDLPNNTQRAEDQLAGRIPDPVTAQPLTNYAVAGSGPGGSYTVTNFINWEQAGGETAAASPYPDNFNSEEPVGAPIPNSTIPGIPGTDPDSPGNIDNIAAEIVAYLEFSAGLHRLGVNSDDGFRLTAARDPHDPAAIELGVFSGGRGAADSLFYVLVQDAGIYPVRLIWYEGGGGANIEFFSVNQTTGEKILINDRSNLNGFKAYSRLTTPAGPYVSVAPHGGAANVYAGAPIVARIFDRSTAVPESSVSLSFNGSVVSPATSKAQSVTTVTYDPPGVMASGSTNQVTLVYNDGGSPAVNVTNTWQFVVQNYSTLPVIPAAYAIPLASVNTTSSGFTADIYQMGDDNSVVVARTGFPNNNQVEAAEREIARGYTNATTSQPYQNLVSPGLEPDGRHVVDRINWNEDGAVAAGGFNLNVGFDDVEIAGLSAGDQNWVVTEAITYLDLTAGIHQFGVNCDDGFTLSTSSDVRSASGLQLGIRSPGGGAADTLFSFVVQQDGIYPMRLLWWEGTGDASVEFFVVEQNSGARRLINDRNSYFAVKGYRVATVVARPVFTLSRLSGNTLTIDWTGSGRLQEAAILTGSNNDWSEVQNPAKPYTIQVGTSGQKFYRLISP